MTKYLADTLNNISIPKSAKDPYAVAIAKRDFAGDTEGTRQIGGGKIYYINDAERAHSNINHSIECMTQPATSKNHASAWQLARIYYDSSCIATATSSGSCIFFDSICS